MNRITCGECGRVQYAERPNCSQCGATLDLSSPPPTQDTVAFGLAFVLAGLAFGAFAMFFKDWEFSAVPWFSWVLIALGAPFVLAPRVPALAAFTRDAARSEVAAQKGPEDRGTVGRRVAALGGMAAALFDAAGAVTSQLGWEAALLDVGSLGYLSAAVLIALTWLTTRGSRVAAVSLFLTTFASRLYFFLFLPDIDEETQRSLIGLGLFCAAATFFGIPANFSGTRDEPPSP